MPPDGAELLAHWREAGEWWCGAPEREVHRWLDKKGVLREEIQPYHRKSAGGSSSVRVRRVRDEKVSLACGMAVPDNYGNAKAQAKKGVLLHAMSGCAFGRSTMIAAEIPAMAAEQGYHSALLADPFALTGAYEFQKTAGIVGIKPLIGATIEMEEGGELVLIAKDAEGYRTLSRLITECHLSEPRGYPLCNPARLAKHTKGLICLTGGNNGPLDRMLMRREWHAAEDLLKNLIRIYNSRVYVQVERSFLPWSISVEKRLLELCERHKVTPVAGGPVLHQHPEHFPAQDVLTCIHTLCLIEEIDGRKPRRDSTQANPHLPPRRELNAERHLRSAQSLRKIYADQSQLIENAEQIAEQCEDWVLPGRINPPQFCKDEGSLLTRLVEAGAHLRYPRQSPKLRARLKIELDRIIRLGYSRHFLIAWDMCNWAQEQGILHSGRGSVVDSRVAYCLGLSRIDADKFKLHFDRFLPADGSKRPDIDIDFEAARREDVRQYLVRKYGDEHVATVAAIGTYGSRGIVREAGKVLGIPIESISYLTKRLHGSVTPERLETALDARPELRDSQIPREKFHWIFKLSEQLMDLPRSLRAHSSGVIVSEVPIADVVPVVHSGVEGVKIIQWDKRSAKHCFDKFDVLCLRGNDVLGGAVRNADHQFNVTDLPLDDPETYRAMRAGELIGIPQSASPAMRQAHIRIGTSDLKEAGIVQAGIRPGVGGAVKLNEYIARRQGKRFNLVHPKMERILGPTLGIVVFQEQIDQLLQTFGGYSGDDAERIREGIHKDRHDFASKIKDDVVSKIIEKGFNRLVAEEVYTLVSGFKGYGFAEGHALSFAEVSIRSIWCQQNYPAPYFAALLDAQPAGYYGPATIANEARGRGVKVLPPCVNRSGLKYTVEDVKSDEDPILTFPQGGIRVSLEQISGISKEIARRIIECQPFGSFFDFVARVRPARDELEQIINCGACDDMTSNRRSLLWAMESAMSYADTVKSRPDTLPLTYPEPQLPTVADFTETEKAIAERRILGLDVKRHLMGFERDRISARGGLTSAEASRYLGSEKIFVVGNPIRLRFPPTQSGRRVMFFDLEDETGLLNVTCFDDVYQRDGHKVICNPYITVWGQTQNRDGHIAFMAKTIHPYTPEHVKQGEIVDPLPLVTADFLVS